MIVDEDERLGSDDMGACVVTVDSKPWAFSFRRLDACATMADLDGKGE